MFLSIIVPVYNVEKYIKKCLDSILQLRNIEYELIIVIGNSSDNSNLLCEQYKDKFSQIIVLTQNGDGLSNARNCGVAIASGTFLIFIDGDDYIDAFALEKSLKKLSQLSSLPDMLISDFFLLNNQEEVYGIRNQIPETEEINLTYNYLKLFLKHKQNYWNVWRTIYRLDFLKTHNIMFKENMKCEDIDYSTVCLTVAREIFFYHNPYYFYRVRRDGSLANVIMLKNMEDLIIILENNILLLFKQSTFPYSHIMIKKLLKEYFFSLFLIHSMEPNNKKKAIETFESKRYLFRYYDKFHIIYHMIMLANVSLLAKIVTLLRDFRRWILKIK